jgi:hypothetical protein
VPLGRIRARPSCTVALGPRSRRWLGPCAQHARPAFTALARPVCAARGLRLPSRPQPAWPATARRSAAHARAVTAPGRVFRRSRRQRHSGGGGANGGGRAPTTVRLPTGHGGRGDSSLELLVDGQGEKTSLAAAFFRRGGATVASGGPAMGRREGEVSLTLHRQKRREGARLRSPWACSRRQRRPDSDGRGARTTTVGFGPGDGAVGMSAIGMGEARQREAVRTAPAARSERRCRDAGARSRQRF